MHKNFHKTAKQFYAQKWPEKNTFLQNQGWTLVSGARIKKKKKNTGLTYKAYKVLKGEVFLILQV